MKHCGGENERALLPLFLYRIGIDQTEDRCTFQRLIVAKWRKQSSETVASMVLLTVRRADKQEVVTTSGGDLQPSFTLFLTDNIAEILW